MSLPDNAVWPSLAPSPIVAQGTLRPDGLLEFDEDLHRPPGRVQVIVQPIPELEGGLPDWLEVLYQIRREQQARGFEGLSKEEIDAEISRLRDDDEYEGRWRRIYEAMETRTPPAENP